ncbi:hypothetical protein JCM10449v2_002068 [Rhodotorula kratochvilovae]
MAAPRPGVGDVFASPTHYKAAVFRFAASQGVYLANAGSTRGRHYFRCNLAPSAADAAADDPKSCSYVFAARQLSKGSSTVQLYKVNLKHSCDPAARANGAADAIRKMRERADELDETLKEREERREGKKRASALPVAQHKPSRSAAAKAKAKMSEGEETDATAVSEERGKEVPYPAAGELKDEIEELIEIGETALPLATDTFPYAVHLLARLHAHARREGFKLKLASRRFRTGFFRLACAHGGCTYALEGQKEDRVWRLVEKVDRHKHGGGRVEAKEEEVEDQAGEENVVEEDAAAEEPAAGPSEQIALSKPDEDVPDGAQDVLDGLMQDAAEKTDANEASTSGERAARPLVEADEPRIIEVDKRQLVAGGSAAEGAEHVVGAHDAARAEPTTTSGQAIPEQQDEVTPHDAQHPPPSPALDRSAKRVRLASPAHTPAPDPPPAAASAAAPAVPQQHQQPAHPFLPTLRAYLFPFLPPTARHHIDLLASALLGVGIDTQEKLTLLTHFDPSQLDGLAEATRPPAGSSEPDPSPALMAVLGAVKTAWEEVRG